MFKFEQQNDTTLMKKKYKAPEILVAITKIEGNMLGALSCHEEMGDEGQLGKGNVFIYDEDLPKAKNLWDEEK